MPFPVPFLFPYDPTGTQAANKITAEHHVVTPPVNNTKANFIVPTAAPFFGDSIELRTGPLPTDPLLVKGVDYELVLQFIEATNVLYTPIYGGINFADHGFSQDVYLTYQTLGGPYVANDYTFVENFDQSLYHIQLVSWTQIVGLTRGFPPLPHPTPAPDLVGMTELVVKIEELITAVAANGSVSGLAAALINHIDATVGAHPKSAVGLGNLDNYGTAVLQDIIDRVSNKFVVPSTMRDFLDQSLPDLLGNFLATNEAPRFDVRLELNTVDASQFWVTVRAINGGMVMVGGKHHKLTTFDQMLNISSSHKSTLLSLFLHRTGPDTIELVHTPVYDYTMYPRRNADGIVVAYNHTTDTYDSNYTFIGHVYWNHSDSGTNYYYPPNDYTNMGYGYARSYHNDMGTIVSGFYESGATPFKEARPVSREGRPCGTAKLMGYSYTSTTSWTDIDRWGAGADDMTIPHGNYDPSGTTAGGLTVAPTPDLTLGYIVWPYEILKVRGQAATSIHEGYGTVGIRTFTGPPTTGTLEKATVIDRTLAGAAVTNASITCYPIVTIEAHHYTDAVHHGWANLPWPNLGDFRLFDLVSEAGVVMYGSTGAAGSYNEAGATRISVEPLCYTRYDTFITHNPANSYDTSYNDHFYTPYY